MIENMSGRMKKQALFLQVLIKTKNAKLRKAILEHADPELIKALCECAHNILQGNVQMTPLEKTRLRKYKSKLRLIARKNVSVKQKRLKLQQTGGFLPALLAPLAANVFIPLLCFSSTQVTFVSDCVSRVSGYHFCHADVASIRLRSKGHDRCSHLPTEGSVLSNPC